MRPGFFKIPVIMASFTKWQNLKHLETLRPTWISTDSYIMETVD